MKDRITGHTVLTGLLGSPVAHSISPMMHNESFRQLGLDYAYLAHLKTVRIVHGKGTGALRKGVHNYLKRQKHVESYRLGEFGEGDAGVTIVEFKK